MHRLFTIPALIAVQHQMFTALPPLQERIRGLYETKIRYCAPPEKMFEIFASVRKEGQLEMNENDFFRSLVPYNYSKRKNMNEYTSVHKSKAFSMFDLDETGTINFNEYLFFMLLISVSSIKWNDYFNQYGGKVDKNQLTALLQEALSSGLNKKQTSSGFLPDPRAVKINDKDLLNCIKNLMPKLSPLLFKDSEFIDFQQFKRIRQSFLEEINEYEFNTYPLDENGCISMESFGKSIISYVSFKKTDAYLQHLENLNLEGTVSLAQFQAFTKIIQEIPKLLNLVQYEQLEQGTRAISFAQFKKIFYKLKESLDKKDAEKITDQHIKVVFQILDIDNSGFLEPEELFDVLFKRSYKGAYSETIHPMDLADKAYQVLHKYYSQGYVKFMWLKNQIQSQINEWSS